MGRRAPALAWRWIKLIEAASETGPEVGAHRARGDARMTLDALC